MNDEQLQAIKARLEAVTIGDWMCNRRTVSAWQEDGEFDMPVAEASTSPNAAFIAAARAAVPALVAEVERLRAELATVPVASIRLAMNELASRRHDAGLGEHWKYDDVDTWLQSLESQELDGAE